MKRITKKDKPTKWELFKEGLFLFWLFVCLLMLLGIMLTIIGLVLILVFLMLNRLPLYILISGAVLIVFSLLFALWWSLR